MVQQCSLLKLERSSYYYAATQAPGQSDLMNEIADVHAQWPYYGYRKVTAALRDAGLKANHKRVQRLMKFMSIRALYTSPRTSIPGRSAVICPYLLKDMHITKSNQVWSVDITYIRLPSGMAYLFAIIDWYSRYVVGWKLAVTMEGGHALEAFNQALLQGTPDVMNMDQGSQFTSKDWLETLTNAGVKASHTGIGRCIDNVRIERFWRSVKYEDTHLRHYSSVSEAREGLKKYIHHYNHTRPHQALNYAKPNDFYGEPSSPPTGLADISFNNGLDPIHPKSFS